MPNMPNGDSMSRERQFTTCTGRTMSCKSIPMVDIHTLEPLLQSTPDGGRCSDLKEHISEASVRRNILTFKELLIPKEDTSNAMKQRTERSINNGTLSTLINGRVNQPRVNSTKSLDFTSKDHSTSSQLWVLEDTSNLSTTETWLSRLEMDKRDRSGGSIKDH
jgi:hypothetical protein